MSEVVQEQHTNAERIISRRGFMRLLTWVTTGLAAGRGLASPRPHVQEILDEPIETDMSVDSFPVDEGGVNLLEKGTFHAPGLDPIPLDGSKEYKPADSGVITERITGVSGIRLYPTGLAVRDKRNLLLADTDPAKYTPIPQLNEDGSYLIMHGDFGVRADFHGLGPMSLQLANRPRRIYDDFPEELGNVTIETMSDRVTVNVWDGQNQKPHVRVYEYDRLDTGSGFNAEYDRSVRVVRVGSNLQIEVNGVRIDQIPFGHLFNTGTLWMGLNSEYEEGYVDGLHAYVADETKGWMRVADASTTRFKKPDGYVGLQDVASRTRPGFIVSAAFSRNDILGNPAVGQMLVNDFGGVEAENFCKPQFNNPLPGLFTPQNMIAGFDFAVANGLKIYPHGIGYTKALALHVLTAPRDTKQDITDFRDNWELELRRQLRVYARYKKHIYGVDILNEVSEGVGTWRDPIRNQQSIISDLIPDYKERTVRIGREELPGVPFAINDNSTDTNLLRQNEIFRQSDRLDGLGCPIDCIGFQCHGYKLNRDKPNITLLRSGFRRAAIRGKTTRVSELDIGISKGPLVQAQIMGDVALAAHEAENCDSINLWGVSDGSGSLSYLDILGRVKKVNILLYNQENRRKRLMYDALYQAFSGRPR